MRPGAPRSGRPLAGPVTGCYNLGGATACSVAAAQAIAREERQVTDSTPGWLDRSLFPFDSRYVRVDGHEVHYIDEGAGPPLLLLHGNPTWSFVYRDVIRSLAGSFRCIAADYPGFGLSTAAAGYSYRPADHAAVVRQLVEDLDLRDVTLVVQDWGGPIGLWAAAQAPQRYRGLVIGNTWGWPVDGDLHFTAFSWLMGGPIGRPLIESFNLFVNLMLPAGHRRRRLTAAEMQHYRRPTATRERRYPTAVFPREITASRDFLADVERGLAALAGLPALIVWGDGDFAFRAKERQRWEATFADHRTVVLAGAGHFLQSDAPEEFSAAIRDWQAART